MQQWTNAFRSLPSTEAQLPLQQDQRQFRGGSHPSPQLQKCTQTWENELWDCVFHPTFFCSGAPPALSHLTAGPPENSPSERSSTTPMGVDDINVLYFPCGWLLGAGVCMQVSFFFLATCNIKKKTKQKTEGNKTWSQLDILAALSLQVHPIVWPCHGLICACIKHENKAQYIDQKKTLKSTLLLFIFHSWNERLFLHYAQPLVPLIFFSAMETAHPPSSISTLWSWAGCTHAPLIGSSAPCGVSWMCALLTRIAKPPQKLLRWGGSGKTTLGFWLFPY